MISYIDKRKIFPSITTLSDWQGKIKEVRELGLTEVCLFLTGLDETTRKSLYSALKETKIAKIPLIHLRTDMELWELDYLMKNYEIRAFNIHMQIEFPLIYDYSKYKDIIYLENIYNVFDENELKEFAGICLDFSHLENERILNKEKFDKFVRIIGKYPIGANHIALIKKSKHTDETGETRYDAHTMENLSELDYLENYPLNYFSPILALELENSIKEQLLAKDYIAGIIKEKVIN